MKWKFWKKEVPKVGITIYYLNELIFPDNSQVLIMKTQEAFEDFVYHSTTRAVFEYNGYYYSFMDIGIIGVQIETKKD